MRREKKGPSGIHTMVSRWALFKSLRSLHRLREQDPVEEELRGWNWDRLPGSTLIPFSLNPFRTPFASQRFLNSSAQLKYSSEITGVT
jgi:hypothetical protein